jgi:hypothetical protein
MKGNWKRWFPFLPLAAVAGLGAMAILFTFNPLTTSFYPRCLLHAYTGLDCPGCGSLRALHEASHGNIIEALRLNPLLFLFAPMIGYIAGRPLLEEYLQRPLPELKIRPWAGWLLVGLVIAFTILRNLPIAPFSIFKV